MDNRETGQPESTGPLSAGEQARQYAQSIGYTDEQIARMTERQLEMLLAASHAPRQTWRDGFRSSGIFEPKVLLVYAAVVLAVWLQLKRPPVILLAAGSILLLANIVVRFGERYGKK